MSTIVTGDDVSLPVTLKKDGATFIINGGATVKASLVSENKDTVLIAPVTVLEANPGSDWANSLVVVQFTSIETGALTAYNPSLLEIQVDDSGKLTWFASINVDRGTIDQ